MFGWKNASRRKVHRVTEITGAYDGGLPDGRHAAAMSGGVMSGIVATTRIATSVGWRQAGAIQTGDLVMTFDAGLQRVAKVQRQPLWSGEGPCPEQFRPLLLPVGTIENAAPMMVLPHQGVLLESDLAEASLGDPFALIPAVALAGERGVERVVPNDPIEVITLHFEADQVIFAEHGALLFCPTGGDLVQRAMQGAEQHCPYQMLPESCAVALVKGSDPGMECVSCQNALRAFGSDIGVGRPLAA